MSVKISGEKYAMMYGPTVGDKVRLADTSLVIEVEKDYTTYGDACPPLYSTASFRETESSPSPSSSRTSQANWYG